MVPPKPPDSRRAAATLSAALHGELLATFRSRRQHQEFLLSCVKSTRPSQPSSTCIGSSATAVVASIEGQCMAGDMITLALALSQSTVRGSTKSNASFR